jgi:hypothetical protein
MANSKDRGRNVAEYETIKAVLFNEYYDLLRQINTLRDDRLREDTKKYQRTVTLIENRLFFIANVAGASKNISEKAVKKILGIKPDQLKDKEEQEELNVDLSQYNTKQELIKYLQSLATMISLDMGETGFLDTRMDNDKEVELSDDLEAYFLNKKPAIYDR